ncbi:MAG: FecR domain-containing protein [Verrucomicrobiae bacterium]|nr:FecR domain-containing protein [Verrucomicrobiae bacterium]
MKNLTCLPLFLGCVLAVSNAHAIDLKQSKVTQVVNDVQIISVADQQEKAVAVNDIFSMPDILRTGPASRAELIAADETVTRVGANTIFSFDPATRTIDLKQGSLLFHSPHGKGGGTIHTGSATASVLGTTLIVTTTPDGGMKVLDLEGSVEVKFLNGLKQNLAPGNMAFVLPGGTQLSPIIIFRLDSLTQGSKLVNGFSGPLSSMPLIQQAIDKQLKALNDGNLTDTGKLITGGTIIDLNTLQAALDQSFINTHKVTLALSVDALINHSSLSYAGIPVPPERVFLHDPDAPFLLPGNTFFPVNPPFFGFFGFAGRDITFNSSGNNPLSVDLSPYASVSEFDFVAARDMVLNGTLSFEGDSTIFSLVGGRSITVAAGSSISADFANFNWETPGGLTLNQVHISNNRGNTVFGPGGDFNLNNSYINSYGNITVLTPGSINITQGTLGGDTMFLTSRQHGVTITSSTLSVNSFGTVNAPGDITINNSTLNANTGSGGWSLTSSAGALNLSGLSVNASSLLAKAFTDLTLDGAGRSLNVATMNLTAGGNLNINSANLGGLALANLIGNTITVSDTTFSANGVYNFGVSSGHAYVNDGVHNGAANFIRDSIGNTALSSTSQLDFSTGPSSTAGLHVYSSHAN